MFNGSTQARLVRWGTAAAAGLLSLGLLNTAALAAPPQPGSNAPGVPLVQQFQDVPDTNGFSSYINNLYLDGVISGYGCGGAGEPCVPAANLPYYRPNNGVTRAQMAKFVDNGRRNIATATGVSLTLTGVGRFLNIDTDAFRAIYAATSSNGEAVHGRCGVANACYGVEGDAPNAGNYGGVFYGGYTGVYTAQYDANGNGVNATANGAGSYGGSFRSTNYRGLYAEGLATSWYSLYVEGGGGPVGAYVNGNMVVTGTCCGPQSNIVQNAGGSALEVGDIVSIVGSSAAVFGDTPVVLVQKAAGAGETGVVGVVTGGMYVPDAATKAAYTAEQQARREATTRRDQAMQAAKAAGTKLDAAQYTIPDATITDVQGTVHPAAGVTSIGSNGYAQLVASGPVAAVKVDASFGAVHAGDLLVASPHAGYAMKAGKDAPSGATLGKALGTLESGTGTLSVFLTLK